MKNKPTIQYIQGTIDHLRDKVENGKLKIERKKLREKVIHDNNIEIPDYKRDLICKNARKTAHNAISNAKRDVSNDTRDGLGI